MIYADHEHLGTSCLLRCARDWITPVKMTVNYDDPVSVSE
jgi:hypothetical protein